MATIEEIRAAYERRMSVTAAGYYEKAIATLLAALDDAQAQMARDAPVLAAVPLVVENYRAQCEALAAYHDGIRARTHPSPQSYWTAQDRLRDRLTILARLEDARRAATPPTP